MPVPRTSIRKLFREHLSGKGSIRVKPEERERLGQEILQRLQRFDGVDTDRHRYVSGPDQNRIVCSFSLKDPSGGYYYYSNDFRLLVGDAGELIVKAGYYEEATVPSLDALEDFVLACLERLRRRQALGAKRQKVRELKAQAVVAQVRKLARELEFDFMTQTDSQKLKLFVKLSDEQAVQLAIPFNKFEQILPQLRMMINSLRELYATGIHFKLVTRAQWGWRAEWISHKDG